MYLEKNSIISGDAGHNAYPDTGASGIRQEDDVTKEIWELVQAKLQALSFKTVDCTPWNTRFNSVNGSLGFRVQTANKSESTLHLCIHFNKFNSQANGVECWVSQLGGNSEKYARNICTEISKLGFTNRGVKVGNLYVPNYTKMSCVLLECCFVDSPKDMGLYQKDSMANAIVCAITGQTSSNSIVKPTPSQPVIVQTPISESILNANATVLNDRLFARDINNNILPNRWVDINDDIQVVDVNHTTQLALVIYPTSRGSVKAYVTNATNCIKYKYAYQWANGSTPEIVYQDSSCTIPIGSLDPYEKATPLYRQNGKLHVCYNTSKGVHTKSGFVKYNGGFSKF